MIEMSQLQQSSRYLVTFHVFVPRFVDEKLDFGRGHPKKIDEMQKTRSKSCDRCRIRSWLARGHRLGLAKTSALYIWQLMEVLLNVLGHVWPMSHRINPNESCRVCRPAGNGKEAKDGPPFDFAHPSTDSCLGEIPVIVSADPFAFVSLFCG